MNLTRQVFKSFNAFLPPVVFPWREHVLESFWRAVCRLYLNLRCLPAWGGFFSLLGDWNSERFIGVQVKPQVLGTVRKTLGNLKVHCFPLWFFFPLSYLLSMCSWATQWAVACICALVNAVACIWNPWQTPIQPLTSWLDVRSSLKPSLIPQTESFHPQY